MSSLIAVGPVRAALVATLISISTVYCSPPRAAASESFPLTAGQRRDLNRLAFLCNLKIAERARDNAQITQMLSSAEKRLAILNRALPVKATKSPHPSKELAAMFRACCFRIAGEAVAAKDYRRAGDCLDRIVRCGQELNHEEELMIGRLYAEAGLYSKAIGPLRSYLKALDPDGDGRRRPDHDFAAPDRLRAMLRDGEWVAGNPGRAAEAGRELTGIYNTFKVPGDPAGVIEMIAIFRGEYTNSPVDADLQALQEELTVRRNLVAARRNLALSCCEAAESASEPQVNSGRTRSLCREGLAAAESALKIMPRDWQLVLLRSRCLLGGGNPGQAVQVLLELRRGLTAGSEPWWQATVLLYRAYQTAGERDSASKLLRRLQLEYPREGAVRLSEEIRTP